MVTPPSGQSVGVRNGVPGVKTGGVDGVVLIWSDAKELIDEVELLREHVVKTAKIWLINSNVADLWYTSFLSK